MIPVIPVPVALRPAGAPAPAEILDAEEGASARWRKVNIIKSYMKEMKKSSRIFKFFGCMAGIK
jgi:hypothetical protein